MAIMKLKDAIDIINARCGRQGFHKRKHILMSGKSGLHGEKFYEAWDNQHAET